MYCQTCQKFIPSGGCSSCTKSEVVPPIHDPKNVYFVRPSFHGFGLIRILERWAPEGYEDSRGFHFGRPPESRKEVISESKQA